MIYVMYDEYYYAVCQNALPVTTFHPETLHFYDWQFNISADISAKLLRIDCYHQYS